MENILENKAKFFALYWGQNLLTSTYHHPNLYSVNRGNIRAQEEDYLELKPLSSISDEDAIEVGKTCLIYANEYDNTVSDIELLNYCHTEYVQPDEYLRSTPQYVLDLLRSKGYALPYMGLSVEELVNRGWIKLKGETK